MTTYTRDLTPEPSAIADDEFTLLGIVSGLLHWRKTIAICVALGALVGGTVSLLRPRQFASRAIFTPQSGSDQMSGLALAASQFGIRMPSAGSAWPPAIYADLMESRGLLEPLVSDTLTVREEGGRRIPVVDLLEIDGPPSAQRKERAVRRLRTWLDASEVKRIGAVQLVVTTRWPSVSLALAQRLVAAVDRFNTYTRQSQAGAERQFVQNRADEAERALREAEDRMQFFLQRNRVATSPDLTFERDRLQREITLRQQTYTTLLQSQEEARIREVRDTPVITILEQPALPAIPESRHVAANAAMGAIIGFLLAMVLYAVGVARRSTSPSVREFFLALDETLPRFMRRRRPA